MATSKRKRLLIACRDHLYSEVKTKLATDKQMKILADMEKKLRVIR
jgi:hypothetical protein